MYPTIRHDEVVRVEPVEPARLALGVIVLSQCGEAITAHRLVRIDEEGPPSLADGQSAGRPAYVLRGDACSACDSPISGSRIVGKVVAIERRGRQVDPYGLRSEWVRRIYAQGVRLKSILRSIW